MAERHYKQELNAFVDHELPRELHQSIAAHLMQCTDCRAEHDRIKTGAALAAQMHRADAPERVWREIENALDGRDPVEMALISRGSYFGFRSVAGYAVGLLIVAGLISVAYLTLFRPDSREVERAADASPQIQSEPLPSPELAIIPVNSPTPDPAGTPPNSNAPAQTAMPMPELAAVNGWQIETISGTPRVGTASTAINLAVGDFLETDDASRARITVANIGNVEIEPNSRVKLVGTTPVQHRLSLERGVLQAKIAAPPRLFIVDTPSSVAVDLGCEYKLAVDKGGSTRLHVTRGFVALERAGRESIVPAGAVCVTKRGKGLGTPYAADTSEAFRAALERFDFSGGGSASVKAMLASRSFYDMVTLWHLLSRVPGTDREAVFDALSGYVKPPADVTRDGIFALDKKMLSSWRAEVERVWFE